MRKIKRFCTNRSTETKKSKLNFTFSIIRDINMCSLVIIPDNILVFLKLMPMMCELLVIQRVLIRFCVSHVCMSMMFIFFYLEMGENTMKHHRIGELCMPL